MVRKIVIKLNDDDYFDFLRVSTEYGLTITEKIHEMINFYLIVERRRFEQTRLDDA